MSGSLQGSRFGLQGLGQSKVHGLGSKVCDVLNFKVWPPRFGKLQGTAFGFQGLCSLRFAVCSSVSQRMRLFTYICDVKDLR